MRRMFMRGRRGRGRGIRCQMLDAIGWRDGGGGRWDTPFFFVMSWLCCSMVVMWFE
jgi:hypothetical protein